MKSRTAITKGLDNGFDAPPLPQNPGEYNEYMTDAIRFIEARNLRIQRYGEANWA